MAQAGTDRQDEEGGNILIDADGGEHKEHEFLDYLGVDAMKYAIELRRRLPLADGDDYDWEGFLVGWFALAMVKATEEQREKDEREHTEALGLLSATLAERCGAWEGGAPTWFPEPPEWLELWQKAIQIAAADPSADDYRELLESLK